MRVSVKLVVFRHPEPARWDTYASYCPATNNFCAFGNSVSEIVEKFKKILFRDLQNRLAYQNMENWGWKVSENSAIPPTFTDEEVITKVEALRRDKLVEPKIVEIDVELPKEYDLP